MFKQKFICILLSTHIVLSLTSCSLIMRNTPAKPDKYIEQPETVTETAPTETENPSKNSNITSSSTPLLYKVSDSDSSIWLLGSIHVGKESFYPLPDYVLSAIQEAESVAVELDIIAYENDENALYDTLKDMIFLDGTKISDYVSDEIYEDAKEILAENDLYSSAMDYYMPSLWSMLIDNLMYEKINAQADLGVDRHIINLADKLDKDLIEIESAEFQNGIMANYSFELQELLLESSIESYENHEEVKEELEEMLNAWEKGNASDLKDMTENDTSEFESEKEKELYEEYNNALIVDRNLTMTYFAEEALKDNNAVFICVGSAHVVGDGAMAQLLEDRGYNVVIVR